MRPPRPPGIRPAGVGPGNAPIPRARDAYRRIYAVVSKIPRGRVATYGQVAVLAGLEGRARLVGYALNALPEGSGLPWHRVINARGEVSERSDGGPAGRVQRLLLTRERVRFDACGRVALERFRWRPARLRAPP